MEIKVRYNVRGMRAEFLLAQGDWRETTDRLEAKIRSEIAERFVTGQKASPLFFGRDTWPLALNAILYDNEVDPFVQWLNLLPKWDERPRLDSWLGEVFRTDGECELTKWTSVFVLLGAVWRTFEPGTKLDEMPVL